MMRWLMIKMNQKYLPYHLISLTISSHDMVVGGEMKIISSSHEGGNQLMQVRYEMMVDG